MKKLILVLAILVVASPAFAALDVNLVKLAGTQVQIRYTGADVNNLPRAFALVVEVNSTGADVCGISKYKGGVSFAPDANNDPCSRGYGIYPATIVIENNIPTSWGTPIADKNDPLPDGGDQILPSRKLVLEFGSLYSPPDDSTNAPGVDGNLCVLSYEPNGAPGNFTITVYGEKVYRGGVVLEDGTTVDVNKSLTIVGVPLPGQATNPDPCNHNLNVNKNKDFTWTAGSNATSHLIFMGPNSAANLVFKVEQAGTTYDPGILLQGTTYYWRVDEKNATGITTGNVWDFNTISCLTPGQVFLKTICDPCHLGDPCLTANLTVTQTIINRWHWVGDPNCWCCNGQKCGNAIYTTGANIGRVDTSDWSDLKSSWTKWYTQTGYKPCSDYNLSGRVDTTDVTIIKAHWLKKPGASGCK